MKTFDETCDEIIWEDQNGQRDTQTDLVHLARQYHLSRAVAKKRFMNTLNDAINQMKLYGDDGRDYDTYREDIIQQIQQKKSVKA